MEDENEEKSKVSFIIPAEPDQTFTSRVFHDHDSNVVTLRQWRKQRIMTEDGIGPVEELDHQFLVNVESLPDLCNYLMELTVHMIGPDDTRRLIEEAIEKRAREDENTD